jgi:hypothetical protein
MISRLVLLFYNVLLMSIEALLYDTNFSSIQFTLLYFGYFNIILSLRI